jgi:hypothetical protein
MYVRGRVCPGAPVRVMRYRPGSAGGTGRAHLMSRKASRRAGHAGTRGGRLPVALRYLKWLARYPSLPFTWV